MKEVSKELPEIGSEVIGYNEKWIDLDFNPEGTRVCFLQDDNLWISACWCNTMDLWQTLSSDGDNKVYYPYDDNNCEPPTYWIEKPGFNDDRTGVRKIFGVLK